MAYKSGKNAMVRYGGSAAVYCQSWELNESAEKIDVTSGENGGFGSYVLGVKDVEFTINFSVNYTGLQFVQLPLGATGAALTFHGDGSTTVTSNAFTIPSGAGLILTNTCKADVRGAVTGTITGICNAGLTGTETTAFTEMTNA